MTLEFDLRREAQRSFDRLLPRLEERLGTRVSAAKADWQIFVGRLHTHFPTLFMLYHGLYSQQYDFFYHLEDLLIVAAQSWLDRSASLKTLDAAREGEPEWFLSNQMVGGVCYVDLFAGDLSGIRQRIPYFKQLGLTYLHLMPLFKAPQPENDGGYAVSSYRDVEPRFGTMNQLSGLASELRQNGISLVVDLVFNHTSDEHEWALKAQAGDPDFQEYYRIFPDRKMPDAYEKTLREIFPDEHPGAFTYRLDMHQWVWTTFHSYQWDLNYANPVVFNRMAGEMLFLANAGVEVLRLDAVAFIWKQMGTSCENLPEAHQLIQAFNTVARIAAPALLFKSEAIVHPDDVVKYISPQECQISYNPLLMALLWNSLATRDVRLLRQGLQERFKINPGCAWVNYVRSHDDIGWTFADDDAARLGINGYYHRRFLNDFYTGRFAGSFARGLPFQENPKTGDCRISGTCASLAGLEKAMNEETEKEVELAIRRILLIYGIVLTIGGIPLIYLGDELAMLNDYDYRLDPAKGGDSRWVHRPRHDWQAVERAQLDNSPQGRVFQGFKQLINMRKSVQALSSAEMEVIPLENPNMIGYVRQHASERVMVYANFSEKEQTIPANLLRLYGLSYQFIDLLAGEKVPLADVQLGPYAFLCLKSER